MGEFRNHSDPTFADHCAFGSSRWVAAVLGKGPAWLRKNLDRMTVAGFPAPDPITRLYLKADVIAWLDRRRQIPDRDPRAHQAARETTNGVRYDAL